ncbi:MAG: ATP-grasp fold amidoligase family protein, partial [Pseudomonadota bacterium]
MLRVVDYIIFISAEIYAALFCTRAWFQHVLWAGEARRFPCVSVPRHAEDKFLWRKVFDRSPLFAVLSDKIEIKSWVEANRIPVKTPKTIWTGDSLDDFPTEFFGCPLVLKSNHAWGHLIKLFEPDLTLYDLRTRAGGWLSEEHWKKNWEWGYRDVVPKYFVEEFLGELGTVPVEIKLYSFGPEIVRSIYIQTFEHDRAATAWDHHDTFTVELSKYRAGVATIDFDPSKPPSHEIIQIASTIGSYLDHARIDLYDVDGEIYLGEVTLYNTGGRLSHFCYMRRHPMNLAWDLERSWFFQEPQSRFFEIYKAAYRR